MGATTNEVSRTRSLTDFAKVVDLFDRHGVSFVSITQSFNTTSSMGRLTLNVLLSFAQFEREVIGERVRDKIAASKKKGLWVGGPVPLGYASVDKALMVVPEEAETVRLIFRRYLDFGSVGALAEDLDRQGIKTKRRPLADGRSIGGGRFGVGALAHLLRNRFYIGEVIYRGAVYAGGHPPILELELFERVQAVMAANAVARRAKRASSFAILTGRLFDANGNPMTPSHASKRGVRYRYYVSQALLQGRKTEAGPVARVSAPEVEAAVLAGLRAHYLGHGLELPNDADLVKTYVAQAVVREEGIAVHLSCAGSNPTGNPGPAGDDEKGRSASGSSHSRAALLQLPWTPRPVAAEKGITNEVPKARGNPATRDALLKAIARARSWIDDLAAGRASSWAEIAECEHKGERHVRLLSALAFASPAAVDAIADDNFCQDVTITSLARSLSDSWQAQISQLGS